MDCGNLGMPIEENILDDEFKYYLSLARGLMKRMNVIEDRQICARYIQRCIGLKSNNIKVKINRNTFFKYFLRMMDMAVGGQLVKAAMGDDANEQLETKNISVQWSPDKKSYVSAKVIPGFGTLIYMACTSQPEIGWVEHGFGLGEYMEDQIDNFHSQLHPVLEPIVIEPSIPEEATAFPV